MEKFLKGLVALVATLGLIVGTMAYNKPASVPAVQEDKTQSLGAVGTLDNVDNPFVSISGVQTYSARVPMTATSSEICAAKNPFGATSTLAYFSEQITSGIVGSNTFSLSTTSNSTGYGSSTGYFILDHSVASNALDSAYWLPSSATTTSTRILPGITTTGEGNLFLAPGDWVTWKLGTTTSAGALAAYYQGSCKFVFRKL